MNQWFFAAATVATFCVFTLAQGEENVGTTEEGLHAAPQAKRGTCKQGFVWREAVAGDKACVPSASRDQAKRDNAAAKRRWVSGAYGPDTCIEGYVWREVTPKDHVCVTPGIQRQVFDDNRNSASRTVK